MVVFCWWKSTSSVQWYQRKIVVGNITILYIIIKGFIWHVVNFNSLSRVFICQPKRLNYELDFLRWHQYNTSMHRNVKIWAERMLQSFNKKCSPLIKEKIISNLLYITCSVQTRTYIHTRAHKGKVLAEDCLIVWTFQKIPS